MNAQERSAYNKAYYSTHQGKLKEHQCTYSKTLKGRYRTVKGSAKRRSLEFTISIKQFEMEIKKPCAYCNDHYRADIGTGSGIDRLDNSKGYIPDNIASCCGHCNYLKGEIYSPLQTKAMVDVLIALENKVIS